jgi:tetratricopeptide (TPR) repeat protein
MATLPSASASFGSESDVSTWIDVAAVAEAHGLHDIAWDLLGNLREYATPLLSTTDAVALKAFVWARRGRIARISGRLEDADACYREAIAKTPRAPSVERWRDALPHALLGLSVLAARRGNFPHASRLAARVLAPGDVVPSMYRLQAHLTLGLTYRKRRLLSTAVGHLWSAFDLLKREDALRAELLITLAEVAIEAGAFDAALDVLLVVLDWPLMPRVMIPAVASLLDLLRRGQHVAGASDRVARIARSDWGHRCLTERAKPSVISRVLEFAESLARSEPALRAPSDQVLIALAIAECSFAFGEIARAALWIAAVEDAATAMHFHEQQFRVEALREALRTAEDRGSATSSPAPVSWSRTTSARYPRGAAWRRFRTVAISGAAPAIPALSV